MSERRLFEEFPSMSSHRPNPFSRRRGSAYTLLELLVVLAILTIIASLTSAAVTRLWSTTQQWKPR